MKNTGFMGGLYAISEWIMRFSVINLLWVFFNIPILFFVFNLLFVVQLVEFIMLSIPIIILMPVLFFPATAAMFASVRSWIIDIDDSPLLKTYWKFFKENYRKSLIGGLILTIVWVIWAADIYYFSQTNNFFMTLFLIMGVVLFVYSINFFSVLVHYDLKVIPLLRNTFLVTLGSPLLFLTIIISSGIVLYISFEVFQFLLPFFTGSFIAFISFSAFYRFYLKVSASEEEEE